MLMDKMDWVWIMPSCKGLWTIMYYDLFISWCCTFHAVRSSLYFQSRVVLGFLVRSVYTVEPHSPEQTPSLGAGHMLATCLLGLWYDWLPVKLTLWGCDSVSWGKNTPGTKQLSWKDHDPHHTISTSSRFGINIFRPIRHTDLHNDQFTLVTFCSP